MNNKILLNSGLNFAAYSEVPLKPALVAGLAISISSLFGSYSITTVNDNNMLIQESNLDKFSYKGIGSSYNFPSMTNSKQNAALEESAIAQDKYFAKLLEAADRADKSIAIPKNQTIDEFVNFINAL